MRLVCGDPNDPSNSIPNQSSAGHFFLMHTSPFYGLFVELTQARALFGDQDIVS